LLFEDFGPGVVDQGVGDEVWFDGGDFGDFSGGELIVSVEYDMGDGTLEADLWVCAEEGEVCGSDFEWLLAALVGSGGINT